MSSCIDSADLAPSAALGEERVGSSFPQISSNFISLVKTLPACRAYTDNMPDVISQDDNGIRRDSIPSWLARVTL